MIVILNRTEETFSRDTYWMEQYTRTVYQCHKAVGEATFWRYGWNGLVFGLDLKNKPLKQYRNLINKNVR